MTFEKEGETKPVFLNCDIERFEETIKGLKDMGAVFVTLSANSGSQGTVCLRYYFQKGNRMMILEMKDCEDTIPSLYSTFQKADFIEREINNVFGIKFLGHPNLKRITSDNSRFSEKNMGKEESSDTE